MLIIEGGDISRFYFNLYFNRMGSEWLTSWCVILTAPVYGYQRGICVIKTSANTVLYSGFAWAGMKL